VLDLPLAEISPERSAEEDPVLEPAFSSLPREFAEIASPVSPATEAPDRDDASPYRTNVGTPEAEPSRSGIGKWLIALVALAVVVVLGTYFLKKPGGELATVVTPTIAPEPGPTSSIEVSPTPSTSASPLPSPSPTLDAKTRVSPSPAPTAPTPTVKAAESEDAQTRARAVNPQPPTNAKYTLQITAKPSEAEARQVAQKIIEAGLDAKIIKATVDDGKTWYRVRVGAFATRDEAKQYGEQLKRSGRIESYFVTDLR
jgi:cell division septation protein DedD